MHAYTDHVTKIASFENLRWQMAAILKMVILLNLGHTLSNFDDIWQYDVDFDFENGHLATIKILQIPLWQTDAFLNITFECTSAPYFPINTEFGGRKRMHLIHFLIFGITLYLCCKICMCKI